MLGFEFPRVSFWQFWITFFIGLVLTIVISIYLVLFVWYFGKPMRKYLSARLQPNSGIIQEYFGDTVNLRLSKYKNGEFVNLEDEGYTEIVPKKHWWKKSTKIVKSPPIISKSIVSINGVPTLMAWNVTPKLPERYLYALSELIKQGYNSVKEITDDIQSNFINPNDIISTNLINLTYFDFLELHQKIADKYTINVTADDVLKFSEKYLDEHPRKSVIEKIITVEQSRLTEKKYQKYAFYIIGLMILGGFILLAWKIYNAKGG